MCSTVIYFNCKNVTVNPYIVLCHLVHNPKIWKFAKFLKELEKKFLNRCCLNVQLIWPGLNRNNEKSKLNHMLQFSSKSMVLFLHLSLSQWSISSVWVTVAVQPVWSLAVVFWPELLDLKCRFLKRLRWTWETCVISCEITFLTCSNLSRSVHLHQEGRCPNDDLDMSRCRGARGISDVNRGALYIQSSTAHHLHSRFSSYISDADWLL